MLPEHITEEIYTAISEKLDLWYIWSERIAEDSTYDDFDDDRFMDFYTALTVNGFDIFDKTYRYQRVERDCLMEYPWMYITEGKDIFTLICVNEDEYILATKSSNVKDND